MTLPPLLYLQYPTWLRPEIIPGLPFRWYGLMYIFAFGLAYYLLQKQVKEEKLPVSKDDYANLLFSAIIGLLLGARVLAAFLYDTTGRHLQNPLLVFWPFDEQFRFTGLQGMSYHGGLIGAVIGVALYCKKKGFPILEWGDKIVLSAPLGFTFGRIGNFINGELYGRVTTVPWGVLFPHAERVPLRDPTVQTIVAQLGMNVPLTESMINLPRHPSQLYQAFFEGIFLWILLWFFLRKKKPFPGFIVASYVFGYGFVRFFIEYLRQPDSDLGFIIRLSSLPNPPYLFVTPWNFSMGQILSFLMMASAGIVGFLLYRYHHRPAAAKPKVNVRKLRKRLK